MGADKQVTETPFTGENQKAWLALLLAWTAGFADAFGFLKLKEIFFSAVSGNTVAVNAGFAKKDWAQAARHGCPIVCFATGFVAGAVLERIMRRFKIQRRFSIALTIEATLLLTLTFLGWRSDISPDGLIEGSARYYLVIALLSGAMGIQTSSLRRVRGESVSTPYVTGMLVRALDSAMDAAFNAYDRARKRPTEFPANASTKALFYGSLWFSFAIGAFSGGLGELRWGFLALLAPIGLLAVIIVLDLSRPISD